MSAKGLVLLLIAVAASSEPLGSPTSVQEYPSLAQVEFHVETTWIQQCAATVITNRHVLTAASCVHGANLSYRRVRAGSSTRGVGGQVFGVEDAIIHYDYGVIDHDADIAIIRLEDNLEFGDTVKQAFILGQGIELPGGLVLRHAGWGTTAEGGKLSSDELFTVSLTVKDHMNCLLQYISSHYISENMICVGLDSTRGRDLDSTDIGAGVIYEDTLVGFFAFGYSDADDEYPAVATAVGSYTTWIIENAV